MPVYTALPYLALPCHAFLVFSLSSLVLFLFLPIPLADGWKDDQVLSMIFTTCKLAFGAPPTIVRESVCLLRGFSLSRKKKPLLPALRPGIEQHSFVWPLLSAPTGKENVEFSLDSSRGRGERGVEGARALASCVVAPHRWEHSRLGACHASFSLYFPSATTEIRCCEVPPTPPASGLCSTASWCTQGTFLFAVAVPLLLAAATGDDVDAHHMHMRIRSDMTHDR